MKLITAVVSPRALSGIRSAMGVIGVSAMSVTEAHDVGRGPDRGAGIRAAEFEVDFVPCLRVEILVDDADADRVTDAIAEWAAAGQMDEGRLWVTDVASAVRICSGERDAATVR